MLYTMDASYVIYAYLLIMFMFSKNFRFVFSLCLSHLVVSFLSVSISLFATLVPSQHLSSAYKSSHDLVNHPQSEASAPSAQHSPVPVQCTATNQVDLAHLIMMHINFGVAVCTSITVALISAER